MQCNPIADIRAIFGIILNEPSVLKDDKYKLEKWDFPMQLHKIIFASMYNLVNSGMETIDEIAIDTFLQKYPAQYEMFNDNDGYEYLCNCKEIFHKVENFEYHYNNIKKHSAIRQLDETGIVVDEIYHEDESGTNTVYEFEEMTLEDIFTWVEMKVAEIKTGFMLDNEIDDYNVADGGLELIEDFKKAPMLGLALDSKYLTSIIRGLIKGQVILKALPSGVGKTRTSVGDICCLGVAELWDDDAQAFVKNPNGAHNCSYLNTELPPEEIKPIFYAYIANVSTDRIMSGNYLEGEEERVKYAVKLFEQAQIRIIDAPNYDIKTIDMKLKEHKIKYNTEYFALDYAMETSNLVAEYMATRKGMQTRGDQLMLELFTQLKNMARKYKMGVISLIQTNDAYTDFKIRDERCIAGGKSTRNKVDVGLIGTRPVKKELEFLEPIINHFGFEKHKIPNYCESVFKARFTKYELNLKIWSYLDLGTGRRTELFVTNKDYEKIDIPKTIVNFIEEE